MVLTLTAVALCNVKANLFPLAMSIYLHLQQALALSKANTPFDILGDTMWHEVIGYQWYHEQRRDDSLNPGLPNLEHYCTERQQLIRRKRSAWAGSNHQADLR